MTDKQTQDTWLSQLREPIIDPDQRICDLGEQGLGADRGHAEGAGSARDDY